jgi:transposase
MTLQTNDKTIREVLYVSFELSATKWVLTFGDGSQLRRRQIEAGDLAAFDLELPISKKKLKLGGACSVVSCYEAGRDGFWLHRELERRGIQNLVVDPASIEMDRRQRQSKTDRIDGEKLTRQLVRHHRGERGALRPVRIPTAAEEDARRPERERQRLQKEGTAHRNRICSLLVLHGVRLKLLASLKFEAFEEAMRGVRTPSGEPLPNALMAEVLREYERLLKAREQRLYVEKQIADWHRAQVHPWAKKAAMLNQLRGVGTRSSDILVREMFGWRKFANQRQVGSAAGLTPTPFASGSLAREQGISKAGNPRIRALMVEISWMWLRYQPDAALTRWYVERFERGGKRSRRVGIVALARRLLIALWRLAEQGVVPDGAKLKKA